MTVVTLIYNQNVLELCKSIVARFKESFLYARIMISDLSKKTSGTFSDQLYVKPLFKIIGDFSSMVDENIIQTLSQYIHHLFMSSLYCFHELLSFLIKAGITL